MRLIGFFVTFFLLFAANAEYRVFMLLLENEKSHTSRQIQTTLDPEQYITVFPLNDGEKISYVDTWMCRGRTDFLQPHCERPSAPARQRLSSLDRSPASGSSQSPELKP